VNGKFYDAVIENIGLVNNYRSQFNRTLAQGSFDDLMKNLQTRPRTLTAYKKLGQFSCEYCCGVLNAICGKQTLTSRHLGFFLKNAPRPRYATVARGGFRDKRVYRHKRAFLRNRSTIICDRGSG
jgi:hypothetical protein